MKNFYLLLWAGIFSRSSTCAQAYLGQSDKGKTTQAAAAIRLPFTNDEVENALKSYFAQKGFSTSGTRGFIVYRGVPLDNGDKDGSDLYFTTSTPDRKLKDMTILSLIPAKKNQDISSGAFVDSSRLDEAKAFLDSLAPYVHTFGVGVQVKDQQEALQKAQRKSNDLRNDSTDYERRLRDLQSDLAQNKADQVKAAADLQTYIGADNDTKTKYQKRVNKLIDQQGSLEKKIRNVQQDLADKKTDIAKQQTVVDGLQQSLDATRMRQN